MHAMLTIQNVYVYIVFIRRYHFRPRVFQNRKLYNRVWDLQSITNVI